MLAVAERKNEFMVRQEIKSYARTLYMNYRARVIASGHSVPDWKHASPVIHHEFYRNARIELGY